MFPQSIRKTTARLKTLAVFTFGGLFLWLPVLTPAEALPSVLVPGGSFLMGNNAGDKMERPAHRVTLGGFRMGTTPVTVGQFRQFVESTGYRTTVEQSGEGNVLLDLMSQGQHSPNFLKLSDASWTNPFYPIDDLYPVSLVSWSDAVEFCNWRSRLDGFDPVYQIEGNQVTVDWKARGWRLPTEAEWEYAARGGPGQEPPTKPIPADKQNLSGMSMYYVTTPRPLPTRASPPNRLGLYDLGGNVTEWCWDWYDNYPDGDQVNPHGPDQGDFRVTRAGSWFQNWYQPVLHPTNRFYEDPSGDVFCYNGFRVVRNQ